MRLLSKCCMVIFGTNTEHCLYWALRRVTSVLSGGGGDRQSADTEEETALLSKGGHTRLKIEQVM